MCKNTLAELEYDASTAKRAQWEAFEFALEAPGLITVTNGSYDDPENHEYRVNVENGVPVACECPADTYQKGACKHRVAVAIREPVLEAATDYETPEHTKAVATDGGQLVEDTDDTDGRPEDCDCLPTFDADALGCWPCYRDGFETANPNATVKGDR